MSPSLSLLVAVVLPALILGCAARGVPDDGSSALSAPTALSQFRLDGRTPISVGGSTEETGAVLKSLVSSGAGTQYRLAVEIKPVGAAFTNTPTAVSTPAKYGTSAEVTVPLWKTSHHWQAWGIDDNGAGPTASFPSAGSNAETGSDIEATYPGTMYYVAGAGSDASGTPDDPARAYRSPFGAYGAIPADITGDPGDHIIQFMDSGTYGQVNMNARITDPTHRIILRAAAGTRPTMDADSREDGSPGDVEDNLTLRILADHVVISGLRFTNTNIDNTVRSLGNGQPGYIPEPMEVMVRVEGSNTVIEGSFFDGNGRTPTAYDVLLAICGTSTNNLISGNRFDRSGGKAQLYLTASCGGGSPGAQTIRHNVFSRFGQSPAHPGNSGAVNFGGAIGTLAGSNSIVENNTFWSNGGAAYGILNTNTSAICIRNNIFSAITGDRRGYAVAHSRTGESSGTVYNSLMWGNTRNTSLDSGWTLSTYYVADPLFVDTSATPPDLRARSSDALTRKIGADAPAAEAFRRICRIIAEEDTVLAFKVGSWRSTSSRTTSK